MISTDSRLTLNKWRFAKLGGFDQVELNRGSDLSALSELDQKLWASLSCPTHGLYFDNNTLAFLDTDHDGRIRANEIIEAVNWVNKVLKRPDDLFQSNTSLPLSAINDAVPEGQQLLSSAREILKNIGKPDAEELHFEDLSDISRIFINTRFNGDGIIPAKAATDDNEKQAIEDIISCCGSEQDRCGDPGINLEKIETFFKQALAYCDWLKLKETNNIKIGSLSSGAEAAAMQLISLKPKIDDYFTRCQLAEFDECAGNLLNPAQAHYEQLAGTNLSAQSQELATLPLAAIKAGQALPLTVGLNPAWREAVISLKTEVLVPLLGELDSLSYQQWQTVTAAFAEFQRWLQEKPANTIEQLGADRIKTLAHSTLQNNLVDLINQDLALAAEAEALDSVTRLLHYYRDLATLLNNFVSFRDFYNPKPHAIFQAGVLYLDGRSCQLCIKVDDIDSHSHLAELSKIYLAYCQCRRPGSNETMTIVAAITGGDSDNLMVGRNGVFYDRNGLDWDATIVKIIENPISVRQAFWSPYKKVGRMIAEQLEKSASARDKAAQDNALKGATSTGGHIDEGKTPPPPFDVAKFAGIFAAIGLAIGAIGTALASVMSGFMSLVWWQMPLAILGCMLLISGPSMFIAFLKLRQRNLAPVLDACGWAVNAKAYINIPFGALLTGIAKLPENSERQIIDPFAEKKSHWKSYLFLLILAVAGFVVWQKGYLNNEEKVLPEAVKVEEKLKETPAAKAGAPKAATAVKAAEPATASSEPSKAAEPTPANAEPAKN